MSFSKTTVTKGLVVKEAGTLTPASVELVPGGTAGTTTSVVGSQTSNQTITLPNATDTLVGKATTDTLTNKTLTSPVINSPTGITKSDVGLANVDNTSDATKNAAVATLTNKTLTAPVINSPTGIVKGDVGLGNVDNTSDATKNAAAVTLTNKTLTAPVINSPTGIVKGDVGLGNVDNTSDATKNAAAVTLTNKTLTAPVIDAISATQIATPATPSSGTNKIYAKSDGNFYNLNSSGVETQIGSGSGGAKNYLGTVNNINGNGNFELGSTTGWSTAKTTLSGGVPNQASGSWSAATGGWALSAISTSDKIAGTYSLQLAQSSVPTAGNMVVSDAFTIDNGDKAKVMAFKIYYNAIANSSGLNWSGTSANSLQIYIYDVTNSAWIQPAGAYGMTQGSGIGYVTGTFQTTSNSTQYRLAVVNVNPSSTSAVVVVFDDFSVGPQTAPIGAVVTDWVPSTTTSVAAQGFGTVTSINYYSRRVGDSLEVHGLWATGTAAASQARVGIYFNNAPLTLDSSKVVTGSVVGRAAKGGVSATSFTESILSAGANTYVNVGLQSSTLTELVPANGDVVSATINTFAFYFSVPISGWSSNVQMSNDADTRVVAVTRGNGASQSIPTSVYTVIDFATALATDTHGGWIAGAGYNSTTGAYTTTPGYRVSVSGKYRIDCSLSFTSASFTAGNLFDGSVNVNGSARLSGTTYNVMVTGSSYYPIRYSGTLDLVAGDIISIVQFQNSGSNKLLTSSTSANTLSIERLSGPATIVASESVSALYTGATGTLSAASNLLTFTGKVKDSHNAYSGGAYKIPVSGVYDITASCQQNATYAANNLAYVDIYVDGVIISSNFQVAGGAVSFMVPVANIRSYPLLAGQSVTIKTYNNGTAPAINASTVVNQFGITRTGNY